MTHQYESKTIADLCTLTGFSRWSVYRAIQKGEMPGKRMTGGYYISPVEFDQFARGEWEPKEPKQPKPEVDPASLVKRRPKATDK